MSSGGQAGAPSPSKAPPKADRAQVRDYNTSLIVNLVKAAGTTSRAELARTSGLSPATISSIVARLLRSGILSQVALGSSTGGRPPVLVSVNEQAGSVVGIKLKEHGITTVLTDLGARVRYSSEAPYPLVGDPEAAVRAITTEVRTALSATGTKLREVLGVGVGVPGVIDAETGVCRSSPMLRWTEVPLQKPLRRSLRLPVWVDNDVNTLAVADKWLGAGAEVNHFLTVTIGRGIGLGVVLNGDIYRGAIGAAGELGHTIVDPAGPRCECGRRGCLEAIVGEPALRAEASRALGRQITLSELHDMAAAGEPVIRAIVARAAGVLGHALANLVTVLNPERLILAGEGTRLGPAFLDPLTEAVRAACFADLGERLEIVVEPWGDDAWAIGAATFVLRELFRLPGSGERGGLAAVLSA